MAALSSFTNLIAPRRYIELSSVPLKDVLINVMGFSAGHLNPDSCSFESRLNSRMAVSELNVLFLSSAAEGTEFLTPLVFLHLGHSQCI